MLFVISRTSVSCMKSPCKGAFKVKVDPPYSSNDKKKREVWGIEINSLDELLEFQKREGRIIIQDFYKTTENVCLKRIEIYDDWRE